MTRWSRSFAAAGVVGLRALTPSATPSPGTLVTPSPFELECGRGTSGTPGVVVVHLQDQGRLRHGSLTVTSGVLYPAARDSIQRGSISIALRVGRHQVTCEATPPSGFALRGTAPYLNRKTLRVLAQRPVRIEMRDSIDAVIAITIADPAAVQPATIRW